MRLLELAENPYRATNIKRLSGRNRQFRKRVGEYRKIYEIIDKQLIILILKIASRGNAYQDSPPPPIFLFLAGGFLI
jgi:mRNA interferase RelE/StbE